MTARKTPSGTKKTRATGKAGAGGKSAGRAAPAKKPRAKAAKDAEKKPASAAAKSSEEKAASARKKAPAKKSRTQTAKNAPKKPEAKPESGDPETAPRRAAKGGVTVDQVNLGHVFALRPRVSKTFRQEDFRAARTLLSEESYASVEEAARAVADKALSLTREKTQKRGRRPGV